MPLQNDNHSGGAFSDLFVFGVVGCVLAVFRALTIVRVLFHVAGWLWL